jgi:AraC-like DNA-binding protein
VEGNEFPLIAGDFCLIQPGERVILRGLTGTVTPYAHFDLAYNPRRAESFATRPGQINLTAYRELQQPRLDTFGGSVPAKFRPASAENFISRWLRLIRLWGQGGQLEQLEAENLLGGLMLELIRNSRPELDPSSQPVAGLGWIPSYLSTHLADTVSVGDMAERARLSPSRFQVVFREAFGTTPGRYFSEMRVRHAAELLQTTDWTLAHIAELCGFADVHHFAKAFKRLMARTPGQYRREKQLA